MSYESELELVTTEEEATQLLCEMTMSGDKREAIHSLHFTAFFTRNPIVKSAAKKLQQKLENSWG